MYGKIFDYGHDDSFVCSEVSHLAALVYAGITYWSDETGVSRKWHGLKVVLELDKEQWQGALKELEDAGLITFFKEPIVIAELGGGGQVWSTVKCIRIEGYEPPSRLDRLSPQQWGELRAMVFERDDYTCSYCGERGGDLECDHIVPISKGGTNEMGNLTAACKSCNRGKRDALVEAYHDGR